MVTFADVMSDASVALYPTHVLEGCESALVLFAAAFYGRQDCAAIATAGLTATCVDTDAEKLEQMRQAYPDSWEFFAADAFEFAGSSASVWDVVSLDPFTTLFDECADRLPLWCSLARRAVVLGTGTSTVVVAPAGWWVSGRSRRSGFAGGTFWTVLERLSDPLAEGWRG